MLIFCDESVVSGVKLTASDSRGRGAVCEIRRNKLNARHGDEPPFHTYIATATGINVDSYLGASACSNAERTQVPRRLSWAIIAEVGCFRALFSEILGSAAQGLMLFACDRCFFLP